MSVLDVEEALDLVEAEIKQFHRRHDTGDFHLLSCGPDPQSIGEGGGPVGVLMWHCEEEKFQECRRRIEWLRQAIEAIDLVVDVEVEASMDDDGEVWYIEFVKERPSPEPLPSR